MVVAEPISLLVSEPSGVGEARRTAGVIAQTIGFDENAAAELAIVVTELATNLHRHAVDGEIVLQPVQTPDALGMEILSIDRGPGMVSVGASLRDGFSTGGTSGTGLGASKRLSTEFDIFSEPGRGTVLMARFWPGGAAARGAMRIGTVCLPKPGETTCGDHWAVVVERERTVILVADGLGHGPGAAQASRRAIEIFYDNRQLPPEQIIARLHAGLRGTRGAAVAAAELLPQQKRVNFCGLGNVAASLVTGLTSKSMVSHNGTAGAEARRVQEFRYDWSEETLLIMHSDGLAQHWSLAAHRGLMARSPSVIAGLLYRDHRRLRDDVTVLVAQEASAE